MLKNVLSTGIVILIAINNVFAGEGVYDPDLPLQWGSIITVSGGPAWAIAGKDQYLYPNPLPMNNHFIANHDVSALGTGEIFFGLQRLICADLLGQLGLGAAGASDAKLSGVVDVNGVPAVNSYRYKVSHVRIELKGKLVGMGYRMLQPYLSGSFGAGFNHSHGFISTSVNPVLYPALWFNTNSNVAFSYTLGLGVQKMISKHWQLGVGYEFADWGKNYLGGDDNTLSQGPGSPHLYTNELLFSLSYLF